MSPKNIPGELTADQQAIRAAVADPQVVRLRHMTRAELDERMPVGAAKVVVHTADGRVHQASVTDPVGSLAKPMSDADIEHKVRALAALNPRSPDPEPLIEAVWRLDEADSIGALVRAGTGRGDGQT